jgi:hypothetical protein
MRNRGLLFCCVVLTLLAVLTLDGVSSIAQESPKDTIRRVCSRCHALQIMGQCVAGDCRGDHVVRLLKPAPWDLVVDWMQSMGAKMTEAEQQVIQAYLQTTYPATPYPLSWAKVPASLGEGGWNVVTMKEHEGHLYAGLEGNGSISRSADGLNWREVVDTNHYTVYGITLFQGTLYAGTNDPDPQIWTSPDGLNWTLKAKLPQDDHGVISLGVFKGSLYAGTARAWLYRSQDGQHWDKVADLKQVGTASYVHWVRFLLEFHGQLYVGIEKGSLYRSADGVTWQPAAKEVTAKTGLRGAAVFQGALYLGTTGGGGIWRTTDGLTWEPVFKAPPHVQRGYVASMAVAGESLFAGIDGYVFRTMDGHRWEEVGHLSPGTIEAMASFDHALYVGTLIPPQAMLYRAALDR